MNKEKIMSAPAKAVLFEISGALTKFADTGEGWTIFIDKMALTPEDRQAIHAFLGQGSIKISFSGSDEPAEWQESEMAGVWYGVFYDQTHKLLLETIEIGAFPQIATAQSEDVRLSMKILAQRLDELQCES
jgi:hydrogenase-1 operon protein HyaF